MTHSPNHSNEVSSPHAAKRDRFDVSDRAVHMLSLARDGMLDLQSPKDALCIFAGCIGMDQSTRDEDLITVGSDNTYLESHHALNETWMPFLDNADGCCYFTKSPRRFCSLSLGILATLVMPARVALEWEGWDKLQERRSQMTVDTGDDTGYQSIRALKGYSDKGRMDRPEVVTAVAPIQARRGVIDNKIEALMRQARDISTLFGINKEKIISEVVDQLLWGCNRQQIAASFRSTSDVESRVCKILSDAKYMDLLRQIAALKTSLKECEHDIEMAQKNAEYRTIGGLETDEYEIWPLYFQWRWRPVKQIATLLYRLSSIRRRELEALIPNGVDYGAYRLDCDPCAIMAEVRTIVQGCVGIA